MISKLPYKFRFLILITRIGKSTLAVISIMFIIGYIMPQKELDENSTLLDKILASFGNDVFVEASRYCLTIDDNASVAFATVGNQSQVNVPTADNDNDYTPGNSETHHVTFEQPRFGRIELVPDVLNTTPYYQGYADVPPSLIDSFTPTSSPTIGSTLYPEYGIVYYPNPGFSGVETFDYTIRTSNMTFHQFDSVTTPFSARQPCPSPRNTATVNITVAAPPTVTCGNPEFATLSTSVRVESPTEEYEILNNTAVDSFSTTPIELLCESDLSIVKQTTSSVIQGEDVTYELTVTNNGPENAVEPLTVTDNLPPNLTFVSASGPGWSCSESAGEITCTKNDGLANGDSSIITVVATIN